VSKSKKPDYDALRRAIHGGVAEARDAGLAFFLLHVDVQPLPQDSATIGIAVLELTPEDAARLREAQEAARDQGGN